MSDDVVNFDRCDCKKAPDSVEIRRLKVKREYGLGNKLAEKQQRQAWGLSPPMRGENLQRIMCCRSPGHTAASVVGG